ncbi:MAG: VanZ family protein [Solobacterium sp.]|nr:VanZ family protein [Solobacterium sp.]
MITIPIEITVLVIVYTALLFFRWSDVSRNGLFSRTLLYLSVCVIIYFTLFPLSFSMDTAGRYNFIPYIDWAMGYGEYEAETALNILLFIPYAISACRVGWSARRTVLTGILISLIVEVAQPVMTASRIFDITDIINNTAGTCIGCLIFRLYTRIAERP